MKREFHLGRILYSIALLNTPDSTEYFRIYQLIRQEFSSGVFKHYVVYRENKHLICRETSSDSYKSHEHVCIYPEMKLTMHIDYSDIDRSFTFCFDSEGVFLNVSRYKKQDLTINYV